MLLIYFKFFHIELRFKCLIWSVEASISRMITSHKQRDDNYLKKKRKKMEYMERKINKKKKNVNVTR